MNTAVEVKARHRERSAVRGGLRDFVLALLIVVLTGCAVFSTVWRRIAFIDMGYEIKNLESQESRLLHLQKESEIERAMLSSPERVEKIARGRLGLTDPKPGQVRTLP
jgi:cell division protein FtsL